MRKMMIISAVAHVAAMLVFAFMPMIGREDMQAYSVYSVELIHVQEEPAPVVQTAPEEQVEPGVVEPEVEETPPEPEEVVEEEPIPEDPPPRARKLILKTPEKPPQKSLADRIAERMEKEDVKQDERSPQPTKQEVIQSAAPAASATVTAPRFPYSWYLSIIQGKVSTNWRRPSGLLLAERSLSATISFRIARNGLIQSLTVRRSSGRPTVDQSAMKAVRDSDPFPALPSDYRGDHLDVTIEFTLTEQ